MNQRTKRKIDPELLAVTLTVIAALGSTASIVDYVEGRLDKAKEKKRKRSAQTIARHLIELETRLNHIRTAYNAILSKVGDSLDNAELKFEATSIILDEPDFHFFNREFDRLITDFRHAYRETTKTLHALALSNLEIDQDTLADLAAVRVGCEEAIWKSQNFGQMKEKVKLLLDNSITAIAKIKTYIENKG